MRGVDVEAQSSPLSAAFDRAALDVQDGRDRQTVPAAMRWLLARAALRRLPQRKSASSTTR